MLSGDEVLFVDIVRLLTATVATEQQAAPDAEREVQRVDEDASDGAERERCVDDEQNQIKNAIVDHVGHWNGLLVRVASVIMQLVTHWSSTKRGCCQRCE